MQVNNLPISTNNRFALDDFIQRHNPLADIIRNANTKPSSLPPRSISSHSHLSLISLDKELFSPFADFMPPLSFSPLEYIFSSINYAKLTQAEKLYEQWKQQSKSLSSIHHLPGRTEAVLEDFFSMIKHLHAIFRIIQSQRLGIQQG